MPIPRPVLPIRGVNPATLEASLRYVIANERWPNATAARCRSLQVCDITYADPVYRRVPFRVRYRIAGQQVVGCWLAWYEKLLDTRPYEDAGRGRQFLAGCVDWLK